MTTIDAVANAIIDQQGDVSTMKVQKLAYYAHAIHLTRTGEPLINEQFEAFEHGPVVRSLFNRFKGRRTLKQSDRTNNAPNLNRTEADAIRAALNLYGDHTSDWLVAQTHLEKPWADAYSPSRSGIISDAVIEEYYQFAFDDPEIVEAIRAVDSGEVDGMTPDEFRAHYLANH